MDWDKFYGFFVVRWKVDIYISLLIGFSFNLVFSFKLLVIFFGL